MAQEDDGELVEEEEEKRSEVRSDEGKEAGQNSGLEHGGIDSGQKYDEEEQENLGRKQSGSGRNVERGLAEDGRNDLPEQEGVFGRRRRRRIRVDEEDERRSKRRDGEGDPRRNQVGRKRKRKRYGGGGEEEDGGGADEEKERDDDDANADLSLQIVAKADRRRKHKADAAASLDYVEDVVNTAALYTLSEAEEIIENFAEEHNENSGDDTRKLIEEKEGKVVEIKKPASRSETPEEGELQEGGNPELAAEPRNEEEGNPDGKGRKKKKKKEKKKKQRGGTLGNNDTRGNSDKALVIEVKDGDAEESIVMRKLLRGPRYFDPPEELGQSCFNCGKLGHLAAACPDGPRLKPCYVCGGFGHEGRDCPQRTECYVCANVGHIAKNCPNKGSSRVVAWGGDNVCLLCGRPGHEASTCYHSYDAEDLAQVQCYICKDYGHLSCVVVVDTSPGPVSCFDCGEMGHTGVGCARPRRNDRDSRDAGTSSVCYKCGEEGHFARGCSKRTAPWPPPWSPGAGSGLLGHDRYLPRSAGRVPRWMDLQQREPRWISTRRHKAGDRWNASRMSFDSGRANSFPHVGFSNEEFDSYMGPIENFANDPKDGYRKHRKRSWTSTSRR